MLHCWKSHVAAHFKKATTAADDSFKFCHCTLRNQIRFTIVLFQLFSDIFVEDPLFLCEIAERRVSQEVSDEKTRISTKEKNKKMIKNVSRLMEVYTTLAFQILDKCTTISFKITCTIYELLNVHICISKRTLSDLGALDRYLQYSISLI